MSVLVQSQLRGLSTQVISQVPLSLTSLHLQFPEALPELPDADLRHRSSTCATVLEEWPDQSSEYESGPTTDASPETTAYSGNKAAHTLAPLHSDEVPKSSMLGGVMAGLLKLFIRQKMEYFDTCLVSIGGNSMQLLKGEATSFRIYMKKFCFQGMRTTEAEAHTLDGAGIKFNLGTASWGGRLFSKKVPMLLSVRLSQADATHSMKHNSLLRTTVQEFWNHVNGHPLAECQVDGPEAEPKFPLPLPDFRIAVTAGLALYEEVLPSPKTGTCQKRQPARLAMKYSIVVVDGLEELQVSEADWPEDLRMAGGSLEPSYGPGVAVGEPLLPKTQLKRDRWQKIVKFPADVRFQYFAVENGWFSYSYKFELDL